MCRMIDGINQPGKRSCARCDHQAVLKNAPNICFSSAMPEKLVVGNRKPLLKFMIDSRMVYLQNVNNFHGPPIMGDAM